MKHTYLEVTYRHGRPLAAYFYLPRRDGDHSARSQQEAGGLVVDFSPDGRAIGVEITSPRRFDLSTMNSLLGRLGHDPISEDDVAPLFAA